MMIGSLSPSMRSPSIRSPSMWTVSARSLSIRSACLAAALLAASTTTGRAAVTHVIELFTSQGCSSCPPADRLLASLARDPDTLALSFPVDYWDYIGWKDSFASPAFTQRQRAYARSLGQAGVYTPQVVIDGVKAEVGSDKAAISRSLAPAPAGSSGPLTVPVSISEASGRLHVAVGAAEGQKSTGGVYVLRVARAKTVEIGHGENSGHSVTYTNVVRAINKIGDWHGEAERFDMLELKAEDEGYVVLLQTGDPAHPSAILAAAKMPGL